MTDNLRFVFMELGRFRKSLDELTNVHDKWMYVFCHMHELSERPDVFHEVEFRRLFSLARIVKFTPEEYRQYPNSLKHMSDYLNTIQTNYEKGLSKGLEVGREEGLKETARRMLDIALPEDVISAITTLTLDQIRAMK